MSEHEEEGLETMSRRERTEYLRVRAREEVSQERRAQRRALRLLGGVVIALVVLLVWRTFVFASSVTGDFEDSKTREERVQDFTIRQECVAGVQSEFLDDVGVVIGRAVEGSADLSDAEIAAIAQEFLNEDGVVSALITQRCGPPVALEEGGTTPTTRDGNPNDSG